VIEIAGGVFLGLVGWSFAKGYGERWRLQWLHEYRHGTPMRVVATSLRALRP
jgi:hypothetical protein